MTRVLYDTVAADYAELLKDALSTLPHDRALLGLFAELVSPGPILDAGCGPGSVAGYLHDLGCDVQGVDLSSGMIEQALLRHPAISFRVGEFGSLGLADESFSGILAWYSLIHTAPTDLPPVFAEFARALRPEGQLLLAFQAGNGGEVRRDEAYGHVVPRVNYRHDPDVLTELLADAGLTVTTRVVREPQLDYEVTQQVYLLAVKQTLAA
jgi:ubiquinone/menaquinone biosynthesis C-methylase UbiE